MVWMHYSLFTHSPTERHLGCFQVLEIVNKAAIHLPVCRILCGMLLFFNHNEYNLILKADIAVVRLIKIQVRKPGDLTLNGNHVHEEG